MSMALNYYINQKGEIPNTALSLTDGGALERASRFHKTIPGYAPTPLVSLDHLAQKLGVAQVLVKDESRRFGLNAFKALGGSYAMARCLGQRLGWPEEKITFEALMKPEVREKLGELTFVTATDGNHGRGVAWAARQRGHKSVVYMPKGSARERLDNIRAQGAQAEITDLNYDDAVRLANRMGKEHGWILVQDTAWPGYEEIPAWIMQGYGTMANEAAEQLRQVGINRPTHVFVQAGVGSLAGAVIGYFTNLFPNDPPTFVVMEARAADCLYQGALAGDGQPRIVEGDLKTIMAGLACGEPNILSWDILRNHVSAFVSCPDWVSARGMRMLGVPVKGDPTVISGESGAVGMGLIAALMETDEYQDLREAIGLDRFSQVLLFSTEGNTDPMKFRKVLWDGEYPTV